MNISTVLYVSFLGQDFAIFRRTLQDLVRFYNILQKTSGLGTLGGAALDLMD